MVQKTRVCNVLETTECQLRECIVKNRGIRIEILTFSSCEVLRSTQDEIHNSIVYPNHSLKYLCCINHVSRNIYKLYI